MLFLLISVFFFRWSRKPEFPLNSASNGVLTVSLPGHRNSRHRRRRAFHRDPNTRDAAQCHAGRPLHHSPGRVPSPSLRRHATPTARFPAALSATSSSGRSATAGHRATAACTRCVSTTNPVSHIAAAVATGFSAGATYTCYYPSKAVACAATPSGCITTSIVSG
uniref:Uncharacterized protein n=1 Tax=Oryza rufipogon TaxID=4529 RepID=A0A0E0MQH1_ORYRU